MPTRAARFFTLPEYPLATIPQKKRELVARGVDVIDLGAGDNAGAALGLGGLSTVGAARRPRSARKRINA